MQASVEMNNKPERVVETLKSIPGYQPIFKKAFPREKDPISFDNMARAIEVFEATLITPDSRFDSYLKGNRKALAANEQEGLKLFMAKGCSACHNGSISAAAVTSPSASRRVLPRCPSHGRYWPPQGYQYIDGQVCLQIPVTAQHRTDTALLPLRQGLETQ